LDDATHADRCHPQRSRWNNGDYATQPRALRVANAFFGIATSGGSQAFHKLAPTREQADKLLDDRLAAPFTADANDFLYQWDASRDYNPSPGLDRIQAALLAIIPPMTSAIRPSLESWSASSGASRTRACS